MGKCSVSLGGPKDLQLRRYTQCVPGTLCRPHRGVWLHTKLNIGR